MNSGTVSVSYSTARVDGGFDGAGLVGDNGGTINSSYATGTAKSIRAGGLVGSNSGPLNANYSTGGHTGHGTFRNKPTSVVSLGLGIVTTR